MQKILVIDDDDLDRQLIISSLKKVDPDICVMGLGDSVQAADTIFDQSPALILLDISMPKMNGFEVLTAVRGAQGDRDIRIVMLSGSTSKVDQDQSTELGADGYYVKPSSLDGYRELAATLRADWIGPVQGSC